MWIAKIELFNFKSYQHQVVEFPQPSGGRNIVLIGAGAILGENWDAIADYISIFQYLVIAGILLLAVRFAITVIKRRIG